MQHLDEVDPSSRRTMKVMCSVLEESVPSAAVLIVESANRAFMHASVAGRAGTWSKTAHRIGVRLEVTLSLCLIHRV